MAHRIRLGPPSRLPSTDSSTTPSSTSPEWKSTALGACPLEARAPIQSHGHLAKDRTVTLHHKESTISLPHGTGSMAAIHDGPSSKIIMAMALSHGTGTSATIDGGPSYKNYMALSHKTGTTAAIDGGPSYKNNEPPPDTDAASGIAQLPDKADTNTAIDPVGHPQQAPYSHQHDSPPNGARKMMLPSWRRPTTIMLNG